jgi:hypothetical protein
MFFSLCGLGSGNWGLIGVLWIHTFNRTQAEACATEMSQLDAAPHKGYLLNRIYLFM